MPRIPTPLFVVILLLFAGCASQQPTVQPAAHRSAHPFGRSPDAAATAPIRYSTESGPLRIALVRMTHGHVHGLLHAARDRADVQLVGVWEPDDALFARLAERYDLDESLRHPTLAQLLDATEPEAVSVMGSIAEHDTAVEACAPRGVHLLVEKPLTFSSERAHRMAALARRHGVLLLTNYETSWYASIREAHRTITAGERGALRGMVFRHGHRGPREIGCDDEFLAWLTDPAANGGGAIVDFGCYGAVLATWLMNGERPTTITATTNQLKPDVYPHVDDDATIVLGYSGNDANNNAAATAVIQASWAWTHDHKEADFHTESGSLHAGKWNALTFRTPDSPAQTLDAPPMPTRLADEWTYLRHAIRGTTPIDPLSSLELNVIVAEILDEALDQASDQALDQARQQAHQQASR